MNQQVALGNDHAAELDERQRATVHAASHKAFRAMAVALFVVWVVFSIKYDDLFMTMSLGVIGFVGGFTQWYYLRKLGVGTELETVGAHARYRRGLFDVRAAAMGAFFIAMQLVNVARNGPITSRDIASAVVAGTVATIFVTVLMRRHSKRLIERERESRASTN